MRRSLFFSASHGTSSSISSSTRRRRTLLEQQAEEAVTKYLTSALNSSAPKNPKKSSPGDAGKEGADHQSEVAAGQESLRYGQQLIRAVRFDATRIREEDKADKRERAFNEALLEFEQEEKEEEEGGMGQNPQIENDNDTKKKSGVEGRPPRPRLIFPFCITEDIIIFDQQGGKGGGEEDDKPRSTRSSSGGGASVVGASVVSASVVGASVVGACGERKKKDIIIVGSLHPGVLASLADVFTTIHLWGLDPKRRHVTVSLDVQNVVGGCAATTPQLLAVGTEVECVTTVIRTGRTLAFTSFEFSARTQSVLSSPSPSSSSTVAALTSSAPTPSTLIATGSHDKAFI